MRKNDLITYKMSKEETIKYLRNALIVYPGLRAMIEERNVKVERIARAKYALFEHDKIEEVEQYENVDEYVLSEIKKDKELNELKFQFKMISSFMQDLTKTNAYKLLSYIRLRYFFDMPRKDIIDQLHLYLMEAEIADVDINSENTVLHSNENVDLIPSDIGLSAIELSLNNTMSREYVMKNALSKLKDKYDYVLIDCMPSLGMITINALACSDEIIIPVQSQYLAVKGMTYLFDTIRKVNKTINPDLSIKGILVTLVDKRTNLSKVIKNELENVLNPKNWTFFD